MGSNYPQYSHADGAPHVANIAHFNNSQNMVWGNDREMMTCDGGGGVYYGQASTNLSSSGGTRIELAQAAAGPQPGGAMCVLLGTGTGECRRVVSTHSGKADPVPVSPSGVLLSGMGLSLVARSDALEMTLPTAGSADGIVRVVESQHNVSFAAVVLCDMPGEPSGSTTCGAQVFPESLVLGTPDTWTKEFGTAEFKFTKGEGSAGGKFTLIKSSQCVGASSATKVGTPIMLAPCGSPEVAFSEWSYDVEHFVFCLSKGTSTAGDGLCLGATTSGPAQPLNQFDVDHPFSVPLDASSNVTIMPYVQLYLLLLYILYLILI